MASRRALIWALCMLTCGPAALAHPISFCNPFLANLPMESQAQLKAHLQLWQQSGRHARCEGEGCPMRILVPRTQTTCMLLSFFYCCTQRAERACRL